MIIAKETGERTTSAAAAAIWYPYDAEPADAVIAWSLVTFERLRDLSANPETGVSMIELRQLARFGDPPIPEWAVALGARSLEAAARPAGFTSGFGLTVPLIDTSVYLEYLAQRFASAGGTVMRDTHLMALSDVTRDSELVVNCSGVGARTLAHDSAVEPHRGQVVVVPKLDLAYAIVSDDAPLMYAIPRGRDCVFGGTNQISDDLTPDPTETAEIVRECSRVLAILPPPVLRERVGLRPFRKTGVRLERATLPDGRTVIHNYGHGGSGFTLSWGCAESVVALAD